MKINIDIEFGHVTGNTVMGANDVTAVKFLWNFKNLISYGTSKVFAVAADSDAPTLATLTIPTDKWPGADDGEGDRE